MIQKLWCIISGTWLIHMWFIRGTWLVYTHTHIRVRGTRHVHTHARQSQWIGHYATIKKLWCTKCGMWDMMHSYVVCMWDMTRLYPHTFICSLYVEHDLFIPTHIRVNQSGTAWRSKSCSAGASMWMTHTDAHRTTHIDTHAQTHTHTHTHTYTHTHTHRQTRT